MITAIIIDDEKHCIDTLSRMIDTNCKQSIHLLSSAQSVEEGIEIINKYKPQLLFLDIEIYDKTGFDLLNRLSEINFEIIFTTAYDKYAVEAFDFSAVSYLLKPIEIHKLKEAVERSKDKIFREGLSKKIDALYFNLNENNLSKRLVISSAKGLDVIHVSDIIRCEANKNYTNIYTQNSKLPFNVAKTLSHFENLLHEYNFCRTHQSYLVNMNYVKSYNRIEDIVTLSDGSNVPVSTRLKDDFIKALKNSL